MSKQTDDLIQEASRYYSENFAYLTSDAPTLSIVTNIARHFAEWGADHPYNFSLDDKIDEAIEELEGCTVRDADGVPQEHLVMDADLRNFARHFFDLGSKDVIVPPRPEPYPLTWQDVRAIVEIEKSLITTWDDLAKYPSDESYYKAVLEEFNKTRK